MNDEPIDTPGSVALVYVILWVQAALWGVAGFFETRGVYHLLLGFFEPQSPSAIAIPSQNLPSPSSHFIEGGVFLAITVLGVTSAILSIALASLFAPGRPEVRKHAFLLQGGLVVFGVAYLLYSLADFTVGSVETGVSVQLAARNREIVDAAPYVLLTAMAIAALVALRGQAAAAYFSRGKFSLRTERGPAE